MRYMNHMIIQEHHTVKNTVRIPKPLLEDVVAETAKSGLGKPSVLLRSIILERIRSDKGLTDLVTLAGTRSDLRGTPNARINIRFSEEGQKEVVTAANKLAQLTREKNEADKASRRGKKAVPVPPQPESPAEEQDNGNISLLVIAILLDRFGIPRGQATE